VRTAKAQLKSLFEELDARVDRLNVKRRGKGLRPFARAEVRLLGQMSLLVNERVSAVLTLAQTADMDALLTMDQILKMELQDLLKKQGLLYDEDSHLIWIPEHAEFEALFAFMNVTVTAIDPESALVSKAVKAPVKNKQLIREAIASGHFPGLIDRIEGGGGDLELFARD